MKLINISFYNLKIVKVIYLSNIYQHLLVPASQMRDLALVGQNKVFKISMGIFLYFLTFYRANWLIDNENDSIVIVCVVIAVSGHQGLQQDPADGGSAAALPWRWAGWEEENPWRGDEGAVKVSFTHMQIHTPTQWKGLFTM